MLEACQTRSKQERVLVFCEHDAQSQGQRLASVLRTTLSV